MEPAGQVLTGNHYQPEIGAIFPSIISAFAKELQYTAALGLQGAPRNNITLPSQQTVWIKKLLRRQMLLRMG